MSTTSPNMSLQIPTVGSANDAGPAYANEVNASLTTLDVHSHQPGSGVQITPAAININANLPFAGYSATGLGGAQLVLQTSLPSTAGTLYSKLGSENVALPDLWYYDGTNYVQLTAGGLVNATISSLPGESYSGGTFSWKQGSGSTTPANFDIASVTIRPTTAGTSFGTTLAPSASLASAITFYLPYAYPASTSLLQVDTSGNITSPISLTKGLTAANIANHTITPLLVTPNYVISSSSGNFTTTNHSATAITNLSVTITTNGNPVEISLIDDSSGNPSYIYSSSGSFANTAFLYLYNGGAQLTSTAGASSQASTSSSVPGSAFSHKDFSVAGSPGTYTYSLSATNTGSGASLGVQYVKLVAKEMM